jgi:protocatechuate 3,4-dioxygenase beta subunit
MHPLLHQPSARRHFIRRLVLTAAGLWVPGAFAEALTATPAQTEGPFYPDKLPLDTDNDLLILNDALTPAVGEVTYLSGTVRDLKGAPIRNATVEIWQCDNHGVYLHSRDSGRKASAQDKNFQGFGRCLTNANGDYLFRTIKPVPYPGRTPHIHLKVKQGDRELLTTQCYIKGHRQNERDGIWRRATSGQGGDLVSVDFAPLPGSRAGELTARFDIVLGQTPGE